MSPLPTSVDRMPVEMRKPRAGPLLDPDEVIATALQMIPFNWWKKIVRIHPTSIPVTAVLQGLRLAGYKIVPMERGDYER